MANCYWLLLKPRDVTFDDDDTIIILDDVTIFYFVCTSDTFMDIISNIEKNNDCYYLISISK